MYTKEYQLDNSRYPTDINLIKSSIMDLNGVSEVKVINSTNSLIVHFNNPLSEKQILNAINKYKKGSHESNLN